MNWHTKSGEVVEPLVPDGPRLRDRTNSIDLNAVAQAEYRARKTK